MRNDVFIQNCDNCERYKRQIKALNEGKRLVDFNVLKPIKVFGIYSIVVPAQVDSGAA